MTITTKIIRADFVSKAGTPLAWGVEVQSSAPSPFNPGETITQGSRFMPPEKALADHGLNLSDVVADINAQMAVALAAARTELAAAQAQVAALTAELADLRAATVI